MITKENTLAEIVRDFPQTIPFFNEVHLDYCCNGNMPIREAVKDTKLDAEKIVRDVTEFIKEHPEQPAAASSESLEKFKDMSVPDMMADIEATHHVYDRELMSEVETDLNKILIVHYPHHGKMLTQLHKLYSTLKADLEEHFAKEERFVFPLMNESSHASQAALAQIQLLEDEHTHAGDIIKEIQKLTNNFELPSDACPTFKRTYQQMQALFNDLFVHIFKENSIVFPEYAEH